MITRDEHGIIVQHPTMDGGDSLSRTGIMALCGSEIDTEKLPFFEQKGAVLVRHPYQTEWAEPSFTSRDQVVCAASSGILKVPAWNYARKGKVNKDFLTPSVRFYLYKASGTKAPLWIRALGKLNLFIDLIWNTKIKPNAEMNQFACICIVMGPWWADKLCSWHPDIIGNIMGYWNSWRGQPEIAEALIRKLHETALSPDSQ